MIVRKGYDCIIIGGGISGLYVAYKLLRNGLRVLVLEKGHRLGGRVFTFHNGMTVDTGAGRFSSSHSLFCDLLKELGLWGKRVKNGTSVAHCYIKPFCIKDAQSISLNYSRKAGTLNDKWCKDGKSQIMTSIMDYDAIKSPGNVLNLSMDMGLDLVNRIRSHGSTLPNMGLVVRLLAAGSLRTRESLIGQTFLEFAKSVLSRDEVEFLLGSFGYYSELVLMNAHDCLRLMMELDPSNGFYSLKGGLSQVIDELEKRILSMGGEILLRREVLGIRCFYKDGQEEYVVSGVGSRGGDFSYYSKRVVCAVTKVDLMRWTLFRPLSGFLSGLVSAPLCRVYARYSRCREGVWFKGLPRLTVNNELRMVIPISEREGVIMITYTDNIFADYWKGVWQRGGESGMNRRIKVLIRDAIGMDIPDAEEIRLFYWRRGVGYWGVGIDSAEVSQKMIQPFYDSTNSGRGCGHKGLFVCGENFSERYQQWMEGSLETGARVVERIL